MAILARDIDTETRVTFQIVGPKEIAGPKEYFEVCLEVRDPINDMWNVSKAVRCTSMAAAAEEFDNLYGQGQWNIADVYISDSENVHTLYARGRGVNPEYMLETVSASDRIISTRRFASSVQAEEAMEQLRRK